MSTEKFYAIHSHSSSAGDPIDRLVHLRGLVCGLGEFCPAHKGEVGPIAVPNDLALDGQVERKTSWPAVYECKAAPHLDWDHNYLAVLSPTIRGMRIWDLLIYGGAVALTVGIIVWVALWWIGVLRY